MIDYRLLYQYSVPSSKHLFKFCSLSCHSYTSWSYDTFYIDACRSERIWAFVCDDRMLHGYRFQPDSAVLPVRRITGDVERVCFPLCPTCKCHVRPFEISVRKTLGGASTPLPWASEGKTCVRLRVVESVRSVSVVPYKSDNVCHGQVVQFLILVLRESLEVRQTVGMNPIMFHTYLRSRYLQWYQLHVYLPAPLS